MDNQQLLLQISAKLFQSMAHIPKGEERDEFLQEINRQLDERGKVLDQLKADDIQMNSEDKMHKILLDLDKGIVERLDGIMQEIQKDMRTLHVAKKNENRYSNPYSSVRVMDGMYYDKKK